MPASVKTQAFATIQGIDFLTPELGKIAKRLSYADLLFLAEKQGERKLEKVWEIIKPKLSPRRKVELEKRFGCTPTSKRRVVAVIGPPFEILYEN